MCTYKHSYVTVNVYRLVQCSCTGFAHLVWDRLRIHRAFIYSDWFVCSVCFCSLLPRLIYKHIQISKHLYPHVYIYIYIHEIVYMSISSILQTWSWCPETRSFPYHLGAFLGLFRTPNLNLAASNDLLGMYSFEVFASEFQGMVLPRYEWTMFSKIWSCPSDQACARCLDFHAVASYTAGPRVPSRFESGIVMYLHICVCDIIHWNVS